MEMQSLKEEILKELLFFKKNPPEKIDGGFLNELRNEKIKSRTVTLKDSPLEEICDSKIDIESVKKLLKYYIDTNSKFRKEIPKFIFENFDVDEIIKDYDDRSNPDRDDEIIAKKVLSIAGVKNKDEFDDKFDNLGEIYENWYKISDSKKYNLSINTSEIIKLTEDYISLKKLLKNPVFEKAKEAYKILNSKKSIEKLIVATYKVSGKERQKLEDDIYYFIPQYIGFVMSDTEYRIELLSSAIESYLEALRDVIRKLYTFS